ncbi:MAG: hypothetical protein WC663_02795 [Patescibacteria group bacterium]
MRILNFLVFCGVACFSSTAYTQEESESKSDIAIVLMSEETHDQRMVDDAVEMIIAKFSNEKIQSSGKEMFGSDSDEQIKTCLKDNSCVQKKAVEKHVSRVFYGTLASDRRVENVVVITPGKRYNKIKDVVPVEKKTLTIRLTMFDAVNNKVEMSWVSKKIEPSKLASEVLTDIASEAVRIYKASPLTWPETKKPNTEVKVEIVNVDPVSEPAKPVVEEVQEKPIVLLDPEVSNLDWHFWTSVGGASVGVILISAGSYYGLKSSNASDNYDATNIQTQAESFKDEAESAGSTANIMFASGGVLIAGSAALYVLDQFGILDANESPQAVFVPKDGMFCLNLSF